MTAAMPVTKAVLPFDVDTLALDKTEAARIGAEKAAEYQSGKPFHYIGIDDFIPLPILEKVRQEALAQLRLEAQHASDQEKLKAAYNPDDLPIYTKAVFAALNSLPFIRFLEEMTGIPGLIPDPYFKGAGIHRTENTGYLGIHADFNHHVQMNLERRLNVLIYLNPDWKPEYGGSFEVWTDDMKQKVAGFAPVMNRMCCFSTSSNSYHGNPEPVNHPDGQPRLSIALYYYTATWGPEKVSHSTLFRPRPGSTDKAASKNARDYAVRKYVPPVLVPSTLKVMRKLGL
jgi:Rps23 Pro-64 3,4-dihydroxylase Tpa1-like proline 4-hydroxylase